MASGQVVVAIISYADGSVIREDARRRKKCTVRNGCKRTRRLGERNFSPIKETLFHENYAILSALSYVIVMLEECLFSACFTEEKLPELLVLALHNNFRLVKGCVFLCIGKRGGR